MTHEYWCDLLSTIKVKDNKKRLATQIKNIASLRSASHSDSDGYIRVARTSKASTGVLHNKQGKKEPPPASQDTTTIFTKFVKFRYNPLPIGVCALGDILQAKVDQILGDTKGVRIYIGDIIFMIKDCFINHIGHLIMIIGRLCAAVLKVNIS